MSAIKKARLVSHDAVKTLAIFLVCIYHYHFFDINIASTKTIDVYMNYLFIGASSMGVPLFFMVNGALLLNKPYTFRHYLRKVFKISLLFIIWNFISLLGFLLLTEQSAPLKTFILDLFYLKMDVSNHLWFLQALLSVYLLYPVLKEVYESTKEGLLYWLICILFFFSFGNLFLNSVINTIEYVIHVNYLKQDELNLFPFINPFGNYYFCLFYFLIGGLLTKERFTYLYKIPAWALTVIFFLSLGLLFTYGVLMTLSDEKLYDTVWYGYYSVMTLCMSVSIYLLFSGLAYKSNALNYWLTTIGSNTLGIYFIHRFFGWLLTRLVINYSIPTNLGISLFFVALLVGSSLVIVLLLKKLPLLKRLVSM